MNPRAGVAYQQVAIDGTLEPGVQQFQGLPSSAQEAIQAKQVPILRKPTSVRQGRRSRGSELFNAPMLEALSPIARWRAADCAASDT